MCKSRKIFIVFVFDIIGDIPFFSSAHFVLQQSPVLKHAWRCIVHPRSYVFYLIYVSCVILDPAHLHFRGKNYLKSIAASSWNLKKHKLRHKGPKVLSVKTLLSALRQSFELQNEMSSPHFKHQNIEQVPANLAKSSAEISFLLFTPGFFCSGIKNRAFVLFWLQQHGFCFVPASTKMTTSPWNTQHQLGHLYTPGTYQSSLIEVLSDDFNYQHQHQERCAHLPGIWQNGKK